MEYTSWDRTDRTHPSLVVEDGTRTLATFYDDHACVGGQRWETKSDRKHGASLTLPDGREFVLTGDWGRDEKLQVSIDGRSFTIVGETSKEWIIDDADSHKVGQFTSAHHGVRKGIVEYDGEGDVSDEQAIAFGYFSRLILEQRTVRNGAILIAVLVILTLTALAVFII